MVRFTEGPDEAPLAPVAFLPGAFGAAEAAEPEAAASESVEPSAVIIHGAFGAGRIETPGSARPGVPEIDLTGLTAEQISEQELLVADLENLVVRALARKDLSEWEVTQILAANGVEPSEFEGFLGIYRAKGYVDDYAFAEREVERLHRCKGFGRSQIQRELSAKRVSNETVSDVLSALDEGDELSRALELAEKRGPSLLRLDRPTAERRLTSFLQRKGYSSSVIREAVAKTLVTGSSPVRFR